jgi:hypothetical protein
MNDYLGRLFLSICIKMNQTRIKRKEHSFIARLIVKVTALIHTAFFSLHFRFVRNAIHDSLTTI